MVPARLHKAARNGRRARSGGAEQAVVREGILPGSVPLHFVGWLWLSGDVHEFGALGLHFEGHLEGIDAGGDFRVAGAFKAFRSTSSGIERSARSFAVMPAGWKERERGRPASGIGRLDKPWQETAAPAGGPAARLAAAGEHHDETGQVLGLAAEAVIQPGTMLGRPI